MYQDEYLVVLPIHKHSRASYDKRCARKLAEAQSDLENQFGCPFSEIPNPFKLWFENSHRYLPWYFNDVVGYLSIVGGGLDLRGFIYLKRRNFPRNHRERFWHKPLQSHEILLFTDCKQPLREKTNAAYVDTIETLMKRTQRMVRQVGSATRYATVSAPVFGIDCVDWVLIRERIVKERARLAAGRSVAKFQA